MSSETNPSAGAKATAGYWGYSTNDQRDEAFERAYRQKIPKNLYKTRTHDVTTCKVCTFKNLLHFCPKTGIAFGPLPKVEKRIDNFNVVLCGRCGQVLSKRKAKYQKVHKKAQNPIVEKA